MPMKTEQFVRSKTGKRAGVVVRRRTGGWVAEPKTDSAADASKKPPKILEKGAEPEREKPAEPAKEPSAPEAEDIIKAKESDKPKDSGTKAAGESASPPSEIPDMGELSKSCENGTKHVYVAKNRKNGKL